MSKSIAIDGPAGAGKSTVAKALARSLDIMYLDTGDLPPISERTGAQYPTAIQDAMGAGVQTERYRDEARAAAGMAITRGGLLHFDLAEDGHLYMYYTHNTPVLFEIIEGELYAYGN